MTILQICQSLRERCSSLTFTLYDSEHTYTLLSASSCKDIRMAVQSTCCSCCSELMKRSKKMMYGTEEAKMEGGRRRKGCLYGVNNHNFGLLFLCLPCNSFTSLLLHTRALLRVPVNKRNKLNFYILM